ncbi:MAG: DNA repair protein RecO [Bacteroidota bacterium]|nr:DNA repair protein RecO [Bacteroidota bacterium]
MLHKTRGIVLQSIKYSESSNILKIYTEAFGLQSYMVRGLRKSKSRIKASLFQHLSLLELVVYHKEKKDIQNIREVKPAVLFRDIPFDIRKSSIVLFMNELINKSVREEEANPEMFGFLYNSILSLDALDSGVVNFHLAFAMQFTRFLGFYPMDPPMNEARHFDLREGLFLESKPSHEDHLSGEIVHAMLQILSAGLEKPGAIELNNSSRKDLLGAIIKYYQLHLPDFKPMKSVGVLQSIFS